MLSVLFFSFFDVFTHNKIIGNLIVFFRIFTMQSDLLTQNCVKFLDLIQMSVLEVIWMVISTLSVGTLNWFHLNKYLLWIIHQLQLSHWSMKLPLRYWSIQIIFCIILSNCACYPLFKKKKDCACYRILFLLFLDAKMHDLCSLSLSATYFLV